MPQIMARVMALVMTRLVRRFSAYATLLLTLVIVVSCGPVDPLGTNRSRTFQIPFPDAAGHYRLEKIEITSFTDPKSLRGEAAEILVDPYEQDHALVSSKPAGRFIETQSGVMVPANYVTLLATTIQAHMERLRQMNTEVGLDDSLLSWPARIGIEANVESAKDKARMRNNALFDQRLNALVLVPYSEAQIPIGMNAGVLAHEHFHRVFDALVLAKLEASRTHDPILEPLADSIDTVLRALNEGLADYWAWVYTGDEDFLKESIARESKRRSLKPSPTQLASAEQINFGLDPRRFRSSIDREKVRIDRAYAVGTLYARALKTITEQAFGGERRGRLLGARMLITVLPDLVKEAQTARAEKRSISSLTILESIKSRLLSESGTRPANGVCETLERVSGGAVKCD